MALERRYRIGSLPSAGAVIRCVQCSKRMLFGGVAAQDVRTGLILHKDCRAAFEESKTYTIRDEAMASMAIPIPDEFGDEAAEAESKRATVRVSFIIYDGPVRKKLTLEARVVETEAMTTDEEIAAMLLRTEKLINELPKVRTHFFVES